MIKLTTTETHEYYAVPVPRDARKIYKENLAGYYFLHHECNIEDEGWREIESDFELLGVIGNGEEISEDSLEEVIVGQKNTLAEDFPSDIVIKLLFEKGILLENPIECPRPIKGDTFNIKYGQKRKIWQSYESKLVKAVILKVRK